MLTAALNQHHTRYVNSNHSNLHCERRTEVEKTQVTLRVLIWTSKEISWESAHVKFCYDRLTDRLTDCLTDRLTDRLTDCLTDRLTDCDQTILLPLLTCKSYFVAKTYMVVFTVYTQSLERLYCPCE